MAQPFDDDEPFIYRLNDNGSGPSLLVRVSNFRYSFESLNRITAKSVYNCILFPRYCNQLL